MGLRVLLAAGMVAVLFGGVAQAAEETGDVQEMLRFCEAVDGYEAFVCLGRVQGVRRVLSVNCHSPGHLDMRTTTADGGRSVEADIQAFTNWARANPEHWSEPWSTGVIFSMNSSFPCTT